VAVMPFAGETGSLSAWPTPNRARSQSEIKLQRKPTNPWIAIRRWNRPEAAIGLVLLRIAEARMIQHIEELRAELP
jgi:hypothetical protein